MSKCNVQQLLQDASCFLCVDAGIRQVLELQLLCEILNNGIGGGSGTVSSFSSGSLSPLFTTSVATATTTPALTFSLSTQTANTFFSGPATGAAAAPTFRAMVNADLGTTLTPQFTRLGIGSAADATVRLLVTGTNAGAGVPVILAQLTVPTSDPAVVIGDQAANNGGVLQWVRGSSIFIFGVTGSGNFASITTAGLFDAPAFAAAGTPGVDGSFNSTNTVTVTKGLVTNIA